ncbi:MAG: hypothetical protein M0018_04900 [Nitrospiraceae bacterium]|nr:hypothetical protein [Nitrospiraceae bacterium]
MAVKQTAYQTKDYSELIGMEGFSDELLNNHFTLYKGYVDNTNKLQQMIANATKDGKDPGFAELNRRLGFEWNGMRMHEYYFDALGGEGSIKKTGGLYKKLSDEFGSFEEWQKSFKAMGSIRGVGWAALYHDPNTNRCFNMWIEQHHISHPTSCQLLLTMDMWEHAFMLDYGLDKAGYIDAFMKNINWDVIEERLEAGAHIWAGK